MPRVYSRIKKFLPKQKIIHIVGTNGKGTTGRFLSTALYKAGFSTGHYTSPHILRFNERIWIDGNEVEDAVLEKAHRKLQSLLTQEESEALSYFEYTTFLAMICFEQCEYVVLEAGLGGEYDATAVFEKILTILTPVDKDHEAFLGDTIEAITKTKLGAVADKLLLAKQHHDVVKTIAKKIVQEKNGKLFQTWELLDNKDEKIIALLDRKFELPLYLQENLATAIAALKILHIDYGTNSFEGAKLFGRLSKIAPNVTVDVGHNPLAAKRIASSLKGKRIVLIFNSFKDKDYKTILLILKPIVKRVEILPVNGERVESLSELQKSLKQLKIQYELFEKIEKSEEYLVFGSFAVVEEFLKRYA